ncbi:MAG: nitroreductase family protein [Bacteroidota bacterium]
MNFTDIILSRRSIRKYKNQAVEQEKINEILKAAQYAPSAVNKQPWYFILIDNKSLFEKIMEIHPNANMLSTADKAILVCGDENLQHGEGYWIADCGAATQNILLSAHSLGLGSCWIGVYPREQRMKAIAELFALPAEVKPFAIVSLGYPDEQKSFPERFDQRKVFKNRWNDNY